MLINRSLPISLANSAAFSKSDLQDDQVLDQVWNATVPMAASPPSSSAPRGASIRTASHHAVEGGGPPGAPGERRRQKGSATSVSPSAPSSTIHRMRSGQGPSRSSRDGLSGSPRPVKQ